MGCSEPSRVWVAAGFRLVLLLLIGPPLALARRLAAVGCVQPEGVAVARPARGRHLRGAVDGAAPSRARRQLISCCSCRLTTTTTTTSITTTTVQTGFSLLLPPLLHRWMHQQRVSKEMLLGGV